MRNCTLVLPVKDKRGTLLSLAIASPISAPPHTVVQTAGETELAASTSWTTLVTAIEVRGVEGAPFHKVQLPQTRLRQWFQPKTATGKLKAVMIPTTPRGFHCSSRE
jgi:hypothetical protein